MKKLLDIWMNGPPPHKLSQNSKQLFSLLLLQLKNQVPEEFQRSTASSTDVNKWKATQMRFLALHLRPIITKKCLPDEKLYKHFLLLDVALRILSSKNMALTPLNLIAKEYLRIFVALCAKIYGKACFVLNVHSLIHLADDVINMHCLLSKKTAFSFESALHKIHQMLRSGYRPLAQVCHRLHEQNFVDVTMVQIPPNPDIVKKLKPDKFGITIVKKLKFNGAILKSTRPNNSVLLDNGTLLEIDSMCTKNGRSIFLDDLCTFKNRCSLTHVTQKIFLCGE